LPAHLVSGIWHWHLRRIRDGWRGSNGSSGSHNSNAVEETAAMVMLVGADLGTTAPTAAAPLSPKRVRQTPFVSGTAKHLGRLSGEIVMPTRTEANGTVGESRMRAFEFGASEVPSDRP
jgi:hypothetical protein